MMKARITSTGSLISACSLLLACSHAAATIVVSDPLDGAATALNGTSPSDRGGTGTTDWIANADFLADGTVNEGGGTNSGDAAWLPVTISQGNEYRLSATLDPVLQTGAGDTDTDDWITLGFTSDSADNSFQFVNSAFGTVLLRDRRTDNGDIQVFPGAKTSGAQNFTPPGTGPLEFTIDLDATPVNSGDWTVSFSVGNTSLATDQTISGDPSTISHIGFTRFEGMGGEVSDIQLEIVPEPSASALVFGGFALVLLGARRRMRG